MVMARQTAENHSRQTLSSSVTCFPSCSFSSFRHPSISFLCLAISSVLVFSSSSIVVISCIMQNQTCQQDVISWVSASYSRLEIMHVWFSQLTNNAFLQKQFFNCMKKMHVWRWIKYLEVSLRNKNTMFSRSDNSARLLVPSIRSLLLR